ncbi:MAG: hypothetical protein WCG90_04010 [Chitinophagia bacterium]
MNLYFQKKFLPIVALFFAVLSLTLILQQTNLTRINSNFVLIVNGILLFMALFNFKRISQVDLSKPNAMVRSVMTGTMFKFIIFGGAALWYATQKKAPIGNLNLMIAMGLYIMYSWIEIGWTKIKKDA